MTITELQSVAEAEAWCSILLRGTGDSSRLWSEALRPVVEFVSEENGNFRIARQDERSLIAESVARARRRELAKSGWVWDGGSPVGSLGRILIYYPDRTLSDGASEEMSRGFFNVHSQPPWACWISYRQNLIDDESGLLCWVPRRMELTVEKGMSVNSDESVAWLES